MNVSILISDKKNPVFQHIKNWAKLYSKNINININIFSDTIDLPGGDILFLISCNELINKNTLTKYKKSLVIHASDLPDDKGWSPHIWNIIKGSNNIIITLLEAADKVDSGDIWKKSILQLKGDELLDSINKKLYKAETDLIEYAINSFDTIKPEKQNNLGNMNYYKRRTPSCSELNIDLTIREQFNLLRTVDNERFPAYFKYNNKTYILSINEKKNDE